MKATSLKSSSPPFELNALAPLRIRGLAMQLIENKSDPARVEKLANDLLELEPHLLALLIEESEKTPELEIEETPETRELEEKISIG
jgi:hypothetical protein